MVDLYVSNNKDRMGLSESNHERGCSRNSTSNFYRNSSSHHRSSGGKNGGLCASSHHHHSTNNNNSGGNHHHNMNTLNGSSSHSRHAYRNKSFTKPRVSSSNPVYDPLNANSNHSTRSSSSNFLHSYKKPDLPQKSQYIAMDCEMVGTIAGESIAARVVLIDWKGRVVLDMYMKPDAEITDYRTFVSGITKEHLDDAISFTDGQKKVEELLKDKILVGHGVDNDLRALKMVHPWLMTRDTAYYQPFMRTLETSANPNPSGTDNEPVWGPRKLKELAKEKLQRDIQVVGVSHCPVEDALAALDLYKSHRPRWEACMSSEERQQQQYVLQMAAARVSFEYEQQHYDGNHSNNISTPMGAVSQHFSSTLTQPRRRSSHNISPTSDLSVSLHSFHTFDSRCLDTSFHTQSPSMGPTISYHHNTDLSLDCGSFHNIGGSSYHNHRPQFYRSSSMTESPVSFLLPSPDIRNRSFHRQLSLEYESSNDMIQQQKQSSLDYTPQRLFQRQSSLEYAPPGLPSQSKFAFARDEKQDDLFASPSKNSLGIILPPPGFDST